MKKLIFLFCCILLSSQAFARKPIAHVVLFKGKVTKLDPGDKKAKNVKKNDPLYEETSIVTGDRSIVKIKFINNAIMTLGPKGKFLIEEMKNKDSTLINLFIGQLRSKVTKKKENEDQKNKFILKTRTAAIGVRGTEFYTVYNPSSQVTSLITLDGEVAMKKVVKKRGIVDESHIKELTKSSSSKVDTFNKVLQESDTVIVKKGRYAGVNSNFLKASKPVKISPKQYLAIKKDEDMASRIKEVASEEVKAPAETFTKEEIEQAAKEINAVDASDPVKEGFFNEKTGDFAPKSGGIVDPQTGIYIQPSEKAKFNSVTDTYEIDPSVGEIGVGGSYIPPAGLKLDPNQGFILAANEVADKNEKAELLALNKSIATSLPIKKDEEKIEKEIKKIAKEQVEKKRLIDRHRLSAAFGNAELETEFGNFFGASDGKKKHQGGSHLTLTWGMDWNDKLTTDWIANRKKIEISRGDSQGKQDPYDLMSLEARVIHHTFNRFSFGVNFMLRDFFMPVIKNFGQYVIEYEKSFSPRLSAGTLIHLYKGETYTLDIGFDLLLLQDADEGFPSGSGEERVSLTAGNGIEFHFLNKWRFWKNKFISLYLHHREENFEFRQEGPLGNFDNIKSSVAYDEIGIQMGFEL